MLPKIDDLINQVVGQTNADYTGIARTAFYATVFEGGIYDWSGQQNIGTTPVWNRHEASRIHINMQQGQSRTCSVILPIVDFKTSDALNYNYDTGIYTNNNGTRISKGYLLRGYVGYRSNNLVPVSPDILPYQEHVVRKFTGVIDSIVVNDEAGTIEVNAVDFSVIFMNALNYNYPDINSYRDMAPTDTTKVLPQDILETDPSPLTQTFTVNPGFRMGDKLKINSETFLVVWTGAHSPSGYDVKLQRLSNKMEHSINDPIFQMDGFIVGPEDVYDNRLLSKYVPAYDNWRLKDAIRDICIKAKFPTNLLTFDYNDKENMRLGASEKYPFMKSKSIFETFKQQYGGPAKSFNGEAYNANGQVSYESKVEKKVYLGIDDEALNEAKFKFEFGKSLWDCIISMCEGFGFRVYFDDEGKLTIKAVRQYTWSEPIESTEADTNYVENHCWSWKYWDITTATDNRYTIDLTTINPYVIKARFISKDVQTNPMTIKFQRKNGAAWDDLSADLTIPSLQPYQFYEVPLFARKRDTTPFTDEIYAILMTNSFTNPPMFNGFLYLNTLDETISYDVDSTKNAQVNTLNNTATDVRNQMTIIGQPKAPLPIVSRVQDTSSMFGGMPCLAMITETTAGPTVTNYLRGDVNNFFIDGKYDIYATLKTSTAEVVLKTMSTVYNIKRVILFLKPQTTPINTQISFWDGATQIGSTHLITQDDLGSGGCVFEFASSYDEIKITSNIDLQISEIECYDTAQSYNFVGFKKETLVVKQNISDKATSDWMAYTQLEMHRKNTKSIEFSSFGNPYLEVGDRLTVRAPEIGAYYDTPLWVTGLSIEIAIDNYTDGITVSAIPPMQSYMLPPGPDGNTYPVSDAYDFSISKYKVGVQGDIPVTTPYSLASTNLTATVGVSDAYLQVQSVTGFTAGLVRMTWGSWVEFILISSVDSGNNRLNIGTRGKNNTTVQAGWSATETKVEQWACVSDFTGNDEFLTFNFALPESKKVQIVVGVRHINQTLAYVMEEKVLQAGVYKRENGIRWDGGLNFAKVWPESVDKMFLPPNESFNYMYNRMFNPNAKSAWEDPNYNYYWWNFDQDIMAEYTYGSGNATTSGWRKTPYQFNATLIVRPLLAGYTGPTTNLPTVTKQIDIKTKCPVYKLIWGTITPTDNYLSTFPIVSCSVKVEKIFNSVTEISELNDAVYFDVYALGKNGENVNLMTTTGGQDTPRRWVSPIGLVSNLTWDFTDSQGKYPPAKAYPAATGFKFGMVNAFDIYGEGVEVKKDATIPDNLIDGSLKMFRTVYTKDGIDYSNPIETIFGTWCVKSSYVPAIYQGPSINAWPGKITTKKSAQTSTNRVYLKHYFETTGGEQLDEFLKLEFIKENDVQAWTRSQKVFYIQSALNVNFRPEGTEDMYFRFFYKPYPKPSMVPASPAYTQTQIFNPYVNIIYLNKSGVQQEYNIKVTNMGDETDQSWHSAHVSFNVADLNECGIIKGVSLEFRPLDTEAPAGLLTTVWAVPYYLGLDSFQLSVDTGTGPTPVYIEPSGGPRMSEVFNLYN